MARMDKYEQVEANIASALKSTQAAQEALAKAEPLGRTAQVLNPRNRLGVALADAASALQDALDEYGRVLEGALKEQDRATGSKSEK